MERRETWRDDRTGEVLGYVRYDGKGRPTYVIRQSRGGHRYTYSTGSHNLQAALAHFKRFDADPAAYGTEAEQRKEPIYLTDRLVLDFLTWSRDEKGNTSKWVHSQKLYLNWWKAKFGRVDLRRLSYTDQVKPAMEGQAATRQRAATLLALYRWLRLTGDISLAEDPVHGRFYFPEPKAEQAVRKKAVPREAYQKTLEHLVGVHRNLLLLQGGTGMHVSEAYRFAVGGTVEDLPKDALADGSAGVVVIPRTKGGDTLRVRVTAEAREAAERVLKHGPFSLERYTDAVKAACRAGHVQVFKPGQMRHSVATWAIDAGADPAAVSAFLGHRSTKTTRRFYATHASPRKVPTLV
jgi:integrase